MHDEAARLGLQQGQYVAILYTATKAETIKLLQMGEDLPATLIVCVEALEELLRPFGSGGMLIELLKVQAAGASANEKSK